VKQVCFIISLALTSCQRITPDEFPDSAVYSWLSTCAMASDYSTFCKVAQKAQVALYSTDSYNSGPTLVVVSNVGMDAYLTKSGQSGSDLIGNADLALAFFKDYFLKGNINRSLTIKTLSDKTVQVSSTASGVTLNGIAVQKTQTLSSGAPLLFINQVLF